MDKPTRTHRALTAGLSAGAGVALGAAAFAATIPFDGAHAVVGASAVPFAVGTVAGVGLFAAGLRIAEAREERVERDYDEAVRAANADAAAYRRARQAAPKGVPVIARAQDALSEEEAWADIDELLSADSPVSCDPARSKDIYEIALEEMARGTRAAAQAPAADPAATRAGAWAASQPGAQTGAWAAQTAAGTGAWAAQTAAGTGAWAASGFASQAAAGTGAWAAAAPEGAPRQANPADTWIQMAVPAQQGGWQAPAASWPQRQAPAYAAQAPAYPVQAPQQAPAAEFDPFAPQDVDAFLSSAGYIPQEGADAPAMHPAEPEPAAPVMEVPMADYSGHEDMWAAALAILAEDGAPSSPVLGSADLGSTDAVDPDRMEAVAEGASATGMHTRVNEILEEEFDRVPSQSMRHTSREYLRVIQGGTMALPRLSAQA